MWGVSRCTARFLLFAMLAPAFGPIAMATSVQPEAMHCMRHSMASESTPSQTASDNQPQPAMSCHHAMAASMPSPSEGASSEPDPNEVSLRAVNSCCEDQNCCCCAGTAGWAQPASGLISSFILQIEPAHSLPSLVFRSTLISGLDSARAPPAANTQNLVWCRPVWTQTLLSA
jgi:hypothetical protein